MISNFLIVLISAVVVLVCANFAVKNTVKIAKHFKLSDALIGMTILSIGTSIPEIITHIVGSYKILKDPSLMNELSGLVIGTNIGSDIFQQNFIIGLVGIIGVIVVHRKRLMTDVGSLVGAALLVFLFSLNGFISRIEGTALVIIYVIYLYILKKYDLMDEEAEEFVNVKQNSVVKDISIILLSFIIMTIAADKMIQHSELLVRALPISASFFGVILLGVATAFPELTTSLIAVIHNRSNISAGILIGSNITNPMLALGIGAIMSSYRVPHVVIWFDLPFKILTGVLLFIMLMKGKLKTRNAVILIILYLAFLFFRNMYFPVDF